MSLIHHPSPDGEREPATTALDTIGVLAVLAVAVVLIGLVGSL